MKLNLTLRKYGLHEIIFQLRGRRDGRRQTLISHHRLFSGIRASWLLLLIRGRTFAYHSQANRITSPSASYGVGISEYPGLAVGCRTYMAEHVVKEGSI